MVLKYSTYFVQHSGFRKVHIVLMGLKIRRPTDLKKSIDGLSDKQWIMTNEINTIRNDIILIDSHFEFAEKFDVNFEIMRVFAVNILQ